MKVDMGNAIYIIVMILLAFTSALVVTKTLMKYFKKDNENEI